jgi:hypothetical protein
MARPRPNQIHSTCSEELQVRAVQFLTNEIWRAQSQTSRVATFVGAPKIPWLQLLFAVLLTFCFAFPVFCFALVALSAAWSYYPYCRAGPSLCIWRTLLGIPCPGCGLTRGVCFLVHGKWATAIRFNPFVGVGRRNPALERFVHGVQIRVGCKKVTWPPSRRRKRRPGTARTHNSRLLQKA